MRLAIETILFVILIKETEVGNATAIVMGIFAVNFAKVTS